MVEPARTFARQFDKGAKPVAVVRYGPGLPISAGLAAGRTLTSWPASQDDLRNADASGVDSDGNRTSSRTPDDLPAFNREFIAALQRPPARRRLAMSVAD